MKVRKGKGLWQAMGGRFQLFSARRNDRAGLHPRIFFSLQGRQKWDLMEFMDKNKNAGRPPFKPTKHMRDLVETSVAAGLTTLEISSVLGGISRTTLNLYFARELKDARARRLVHVLMLLEKAARRGSVSAMKYLTSVYSHQAPVRLGKKEIKKREAEIALADSPWADLIRTPERANDLDDEPGKI
jgi:hypothetical protein